MKKIYLFKALLKMAGGGMHPPHSPWIRPYVIGVQSFPFPSKVLLLFLALL